MTGGDSNVLPYPELNCRCGYGRRGRASRGQLLGRAWHGTHRRNRPARGITCACAYHFAASAPAHKHRIGYSAASQNRYQGGRGGLHGAGCPDYCRRALALTCADCTNGGGGSGGRSAHVPDHHLSGLG